MNNHSHIDFNLFDLNRMLINVFDEQSTPPSSSNVQEEQQQQQAIMTQDPNDRHYCLIIFNDPRWSQRLRKPSEHV
jgi:hypothetical protein